LISYRKDYQMSRDSAKNNRKEGENQTTRKSNSKTTVSIRRKIASWQPEINLQNRRKKREEKRRNRLMLRSRD